MYKGEHYGHEEESDFYCYTGAFDRQYRADGDHDVQRNRYFQKNCGAGGQYCNGA